MPTENDNFRCGETGGIGSDGCLFAQALWICCPMCDEKVCVGRYNCDEVRQWMETHGGKL